MAFEFLSTFFSKKSHPEETLEVKSKDSNSEVDSTKRSTGRRALGLSVQDLINKRFEPTKFREGYSPDEVDDFLDEVVVELKRLQKEEADLRLARSKGELPAVSSSFMTPEEVVNKRFSPTKFRGGYNQNEVDDFLDEIVVELRRLTSKNIETRSVVARMIAETS